MSDYKKSSDEFYLALENNRNVHVTPPWFSSKSKYPPRANNVVEPLVNGERAFKAVHEAISGAKKSICIISWGFDPSMRLLRPDGERFGDLLKKKADKEGVTTKVLIWKNILANFQENNIVGDGLMGSGGRATGSGMGSTSAGGGSNKELDEEFNEYGSKATNSAAIIRGDDEARAFCREWFKNTGKVEFRTRDFSDFDRARNYYYQLAQHGLSSIKHIGQTVLLSDFSSHHQKMILVDYELPDAAVGFVMGHNLLRNYWDTDNHDYYSSERLGFAPWQDISSKVHGSVLFDLNENFMTAWNKVSLKDSSWNSSRQQLQPKDFEKAALKIGKPEMAQICRTQPQESDRSILDLYNTVLANARNYIYFENQYFRYKEFALLIRKIRRDLKKSGWKRDFYIFVVTNVPPSAGKVNTYEMLSALGKGSTMPTIHKVKRADDIPKVKAYEINGTRIGNVNPDGTLREGYVMVDDENSDAFLRKADLVGMNIHIASLQTSAHVNNEMRYKEIYIHSKLTLIDDVFFTLGSANINIRSMEADSELNIACPSPEKTSQLRKHLWGIHTKQQASNDMKTEFERWGKIISNNLSAKQLKKPLIAPLVEFFDDGDVSIRWD